ncbi:helix-turn-helix domain-containing protein [Peredibacter starrii]|uniref:Helix-turn-helix domain-containing protein n=1 Tax=Peredibacter starrii TaxID=28202 RepID=A0AAX4HNK0_9BACT|nr:helix-turn-helix domain-containing protein [Peredibacter starrii]WPU64874.1 helix-turn-helix domain-containing protein [Peredibacter starrii]
MDAEKKNYYEVLEIETNATPNQIENAYIRARNAYSGDSVALYSLMTKDECDNILGQIEEAYSVLGFPEKRREYDRLRGFNQGGISPQANPDKIHMVLTVEDRKNESIQYENFGSNLIEARVSKITAQKKFGLEFSENADMERKIREASDFPGSFLKEIREYKNVSIERMAEMTRISKTHLTAIENEDVSKLPAEVYVRGYVYQFAKVLKLNPDTVANSYLLHFKKLRTQK